MKLEDHMGVGGREKENKRNEVEGGGREEIRRKQDRRERQREEDRLFDCASCFWKGRGNRGTEEVVGVNSHCQMNCSTPASLPIYLRIFRICSHEGFTQNNITALVSNKKPLCCETRQPNPPLSLWEGFTTDFSSQGPPAIE